LVAHSQTYFDLRDACAEPGCPVCRLTLRAVSRFIERVDYEYVNEPDIRAKVERTWGFCNTHALQWLREGHVLAVALVYEGILKRLQSEVERARPSGQNGLLSGVGARIGRRKRETSDQLQPDGTCPVCRERDDTEVQLIRVLGEGLTQTADDFRAAFRDSDGLCLPLCARRRSVIRNDCKGSCGRSFASTTTGFATSRPERSAGRRRGRWRT
jgi:hypothetical protein